jgi:hypothetical protein
LTSIKAGQGAATDHGAIAAANYRESAMLFTTPEPIPPPQVLALIRAVQAMDAMAEVRVDKTGRQVSIEGRLTAQQAAAAIGDTGLAGVITPTDHVSGGSTCCGGCS